MSLAGAGAGVGELFAPELVLGYKALDEGLRAALQDYLSDVIFARGFPLHTAIAWNALHFGFDPANQSYDQRLLECVEVDLEPYGAALPVGALTWVRLGADSTWAEVIGKEGRPAGVDNDGSASERLAGRPADWRDEPLIAGGRRPFAVLSEALVLDFGAFGPVEGIEHRLERLERRGRIGPHGLVTLEAVYDPPEAAEDSDTGFYARWLFERRERLLAGGPLLAGLQEDSDETVRAALVASLATVDVLLTSIPGVVRWGDYALLEEWVAEIDLLPNLPLHCSDLEYLMSSMARSRDGRPTTTALAPRLEEVLGPVGPSPQRPDAPVRDPLHGVGYLSAIARSGRWIADRLDESGGTVQAGGVKRFLRVDDRWPWGSLWRSEPWGPGHPLEGVPTDEPLGLGWSGWRALAEFLELPLAEVEAAVGTALTPSVPVAAGQEPTGGDETQASPDEQNQPGEEETVETEEEEPLLATLVEGHVTLRKVDVDTGALPLPERFEWLAHGGLVTVRVSHTGDIDADQASQSVQGTPEGVVRLENLDWPIDFFPGIRLHLAAFDSGRTLFVATRPLGPGAAYPFQYDPAITGKAPHGGELTLVAIALSRLIRHGRKASDGTRRATAREIAAFCFGPGVPRVLVVAVGKALDERVAAARLKVAGSEYCWAPGMRLRPRRSEPTGWEAGPVRREVVRVHWVPGFLRQLPWGWTPGAAQLALYAEHRAEGLVRGPEVLPPGVTYVQGHERGARQVAFIEALRHAVSEVEGRSPGNDELKGLFEEWTA